MKTNGETKISYFVLGLGLGAIAGSIAALIARQENRELLRERGAKGLEYLHQQRTKLRQTTEGMVEKGKALLSRGCCSSEATTSETQAQEESKSEL